MRKILPILFMLLAAKGIAQNVGIGEPAPNEAKLQVSTADSAVVLLHNSNNSLGNIKTAHYYKTGSFYSGSIGTIGSGGTYRMGFFTFGGSNPAALLERLSILDGGNVGIGTIAPTAKLEVNGTFKLTGGSPGAGKVLTSDANGLASWATPSGGGLTLPYTGSLAAPSGYLFNLTNTETTQGEGFVTTINSINSGSAVAGIAANSSPAGTLVAGVRAANFSTNANGVGLWAFHGGLGPAIYANTANGIGANISSTNGFALQTKGKLQFAGNGVGTLATGKFLKSTDALGNAAWADLLPYSGTGSLANNLINPALLNIQNTSATIGSGIKGITDAATGGAGVIGFATATTITNTATYGVYGNVSSTSASGAGVYGNHEGSGPGVKGEGGIGVYGDGGTGVKGEGAYGVHGIGSTYGVFGEKAGSTGSAIHGVGGLRGVYGQAIGYGVQGFCTDPNPNQLKWSGVYGESQSTTNLGSGVYGTHLGTGPGVRGFSINGIGGSFSSDNGYALLTQDGNVGIGTQTPAAKMDIAGSSNITHFYFGANEDTYIRGGKAGSNVLINDVNPGKVGVGISSPNQFMDVNGRMRLYHTGTQTGGGAITSGLWLNNNVNGLGFGDGAFIGLNCSVAGGETAGFFVGGGWRFDVDRFGNGRFGGAVTASTGFACASDLRYKKNITPLNNALQNILKINGVNYDWKLETYPDQNFSDKNQVGFIAQDLEKIYPEMVFTDNKGYKSVDYARLTPVLVEAVKELSVKNDSQQAQIDELKKELAEFKKLLEKSK